MSTHKRKEYLVHPGEILKEELEAFDISRNRLAMEFWMNLQAAYDKKVVGAELKDELAKIHSLPIRTAVHA